MLGLSSNIETQDAYSINRNFDFVVSRAWSNLGNLINIVHNVSRETKAVGVFHKGHSYDLEILDAQKRWSFEYSVFNSATDPTGKIITIKNVQE